LDNENIMMINLAKIKEILNTQSPDLTEDLARQSSGITRQYFGRTITLYTPLYLSNYCSSYCTYCGFNNHNRIDRMKLTTRQIHLEMRQVAQTGIENILLLTGESSKATPLSYLKEAVGIAKHYFTGISLEIHPLETEDYRELYRHGVDGVTVYQETYDQTRYKEIHLSGKKSDYAYRLKTPERVAASGIRQISMGILLGLTDVAEDLWALYHHLGRMERLYPGVEYSLSFPRLRKIKGHDFAICNVDDITFIKIICLTRILFPRVGINLSTRETPRVRDHALGLGVTRLSAGSNTSVGGYATLPLQGQEPQFDIEDTRTVEEMIQLLKTKQFDPVLTDWRPIKNEIV